MTFPTEDLDLVYFLLARKAGAVKIGKSSVLKLYRRIGYLQTGSAEKLELLLVLPEGEGLFQEKELHILFSKFRKHGEWFEYDGKVKTFIDNLHDPSLSFLEGPMHDRIKKIKEALLQP